MRAIEMQEESDIDDILQYLIESDELQGAAKGIALQVMSKGIKSLTERQQYVFDRHIGRHYIKMECEGCHIPMPNNEVVPALMEEDGLCGHCRWVKAKYY